MSDLMNVIEWFAMKREDGLEKNDAGDTGNWFCEAEPVPSIMDTWGRGAIPMKKKKKKKPPTPEAKDDLLLNAQGGLVRRMSSMERVKKEKIPKKEKAPATHDPLVQTTDPMATDLMNTGSFPGPSTADGRNKKSSIQFKGDNFFDKNGKGIGSDSGESAVQQMREVEERAREEAEKKAQLIAERKEERNRLETLAKELKGKDYTFDANGQVVQITPINVDRLPPQSYNLDVQLIDRVNPSEEPPPEEIAPVKSRSSRGSSKGGKRKKKGERKGQDRDDKKSEFYRSIGNVQPSLLSTIVLSPGVDVKEGEAGRTGPDRQEDPQHMSRKNFVDHQTVLETQSISSNNQLLVSQGGYDRMFGVAGIRDMQFDAGEIDPLRGATSATKSPASPRNETLANDINLSLINDPNWGSSAPNSGTFIPSKIPHKPSAKQKEITSKMLGGPNVRNVRDRPFITTQPRKKLPPPPPGSVGHGLGWTTGGRSHNNSFADESAIMAGEEGSTFLPSIPSPHSNQVGDGFDIGGATSPKKRKGKGGGSIVLSTTQ